MSSANPNDILSAFYDREATSAEEAAAKALVQRSSEASREFKEYGRLSRLIQEVPRIAAPPEFAAAVMQRAERESLIPLDSVAAAGTVQPSRRAWVLAASVSVSVAAAVLIAVSILPHSAPQGRLPEIARQEPGDLRNEFARADSKVSVAKSSPVDGPIVAKSMDGRSPAVASAKGFVSARSAVPNLGATSASPMRLGTPSLNKGAEKGAVPAQSAGLALMLPANLKTAKVGDVVEALQQDGQQVAVVRLTVVNQVEGLDGVQSVLVRNTSRTLQNVEEIKRLRQQFNADKSAEFSKSALSTAPGDLICVYVEGPRDEMLAVLQDLQNESLIQKAELTNTIDFTMLEEYASRAVPPNKQNGKRPAAGEQIVQGPVAQAPKAPGSQLAVSLPASTVDKIFSAKQQTAPAVRQTQSPAPALVVQELPAELDATSKSDAVTSPGKKEADSSKPGEAATAAQRGGSRRAGLPLVAKGERSKLRDSKEVAAAQKPFQIFFVITDQPGAQTPQPASNPAKSAATPPSRPAAGQTPAANQTPAAKVPAKSAPANQAP
jgi:hypothetical protein